MERCKEYPHGRCAACGYADHTLISDHAYPDYDFLCSRCKADFDKEMPYCVDKVEVATGEVWSQWRHHTPEKAARTLNRLKSNPDANEKVGRKFRFKFVMYREDETQPF